MDSFYGGLPGQGFEIITLEKWPIEIYQKDENGGLITTEDGQNVFTPEGNKFNNLPIGGYILISEQEADGITDSKYTSYHGNIYKKVSSNAEDCILIGNIAGPSAGIGSVEATVGSTWSSKPSVDVSASGTHQEKNLTFNFTGLKGNGIKSIESSADKKSLIIKTDANQDGDIFNVFNGFTIGNVAPGEPNTSPVVTIGGDTKSPTLNFTIPKGATGAQGPTGATPNITINADETVDTTTNKWGLTFTKDNIASSAEETVFTAKFQVPANIKTAADSTIVFTHEEW